MPLALRVNLLAACGHPGPLGGVLRPNADGSPCEAGLGSNPGILRPVLQHQEALLWDGAAVRRISFATGSRSARRSRTFGPHPHGRLPLASKASILASWLDRSKGGQVRVAFVPAQQSSPMFAPPPTAPVKLLVMTFSRSAAASAGLVPDPPLPWRPYESTTFPVALRPFLYAANSLGCRWAVKRHGAAIM